jgi:MOSC domain-containing protein YiiM
MSSQRTAASQAELLSRFPSSGRLVWVGLRPESGQPMRVVSRVRVLEDRGLEGDFRSQRTGGRRQVTLIQHEHLAVLAALLGRGSIDPASMRRNLVVSGINLLALREGRFEIGGVRFEGTGDCTPCHRLEDTLGRGGFNVSVGHGGITARALSDGWLELGGPVQPL